MPGAAIYVIVTLSTHIVSRDENPLGENEMDSLNFKGFHVRFSRSAHARFKSRTGLSFFFRPYFNYLFSSVHNRKDRFYIRFFNRSAHT